MRLNIISLNIWHGAMLDRALGFLKSCDPDVILLQEVYDSQDRSIAQKYRSMETMTRELDFPYADFKAAYKEKIPTGQLVPAGQAIFSKYPIVSSSLHFMSEPSLEYYEDKREYLEIIPAPLQHAKLDINDQEINVFNMHGVWDLDGDNFSDRRRHMRDVIINKIQGKHNVILAGDSNAKLTNKAMKDLEKHLKPVFGSELKTTFNMRHKDNPGYATAAVDLMFTSSNIQVLSKEVPDVDISDHLPLVVSLQIN